LEVLEDRIVPSPVYLSGPESQAHPIVPVVLQQPATQAVTVHYAVTGGTAVSGKDYLLPAGTVTFNKGDTVKDIPLQILNDALPETNETVVIGLSAAKGAPLGPNTQVVYTIVESDTLPSVAFTATTGSGVESKVGSFQVSLSAKSSVPVTVQYTITGGTATAGVDYKLKPGTVTFKPGQTTQTIAIPITNDKLNEVNETIQLSLANPVNASLGTITTFTYTIGDDDPQPSVAFTTAAGSGLETINAPSVPVSLSAVSGQAVTVQYAVTGGTAVGGVNYTLAGGTLTIPAGVKTANIPLAILNDGVLSSSQTVQITLASPNNATPGTNKVFTYTILNPGSLPTVAFQSTTGAGPESKSGSVQVTLSAPASKAVTVHYAVTGGTAVSGVNYKLAPNTLTIGPGKTTGTISIPVIDDKRNDPDETLQLALSNPTGAFLGVNTSFTYTIQNTDPQPSVGFTAATGTAPESAISLNVPVTLSAASGQVVTVAYTVGGGSAASGVNYTPASGTVTFNPGSKTASIPLTILDGSPLVSSQTVQITLSSPSYAALGAKSVFTYTIQATAAQVGFDVTPPVILPSATYSATTGDLTVSGVVNDDFAGATSLQVDLDGGAATPVNLGTGGQFSIDLPLGQPTNGGHTLYLSATDRAGNTLNAAEPVPIFDLSPGSDTDTAGDHATSDARVTLQGTAPANTTIMLLGTNQQTVASNTGVFQLPNITLAQASNPFTIEAKDAAGNASLFTLTIAHTPPGNQPNAVIVWNQATLNAIQTDGTDPVMASRALAMVQAAVYDAVNNIDGTPTTFVKIATPAGASIDAAVDSAAHDVLVYLYPAQQPTFDALLASQLALLAAGQATTDGTAVGQAVGNAIIALRASDGATGFVDFEPGSAAGDWQPTAPMYAPALDPQAGSMTPWAITSDSQFDPAGPPALSSQQWADAVNQVESLGAVNSATRTTAQTTLAQFWNDGLGTYTPSGHWNQIAETVAQQEGDSLADDARLFAELNVSMADAGIATWNTKYLFDTWRPITVIQGGGNGVNPAVTADANWMPLLNTPNFPEYVSGHSAFSMAAATVLDSFFGDNVTFTSKEQTTTLSETYTSFDQAAQDAGMSRLYGGIHFLFSIQDGWSVGQQVATFDLATFNITKDTRPPKVTLNNVLPSGASNGNVTITGQVTDNLSGVAQLQVQVDGGTFVPLTFDPTTGNFTYTTSFALDGTADGGHTIGFQATDAAGNLAAAVPFTFTLATKAPTLTLSSPTDGGSLAAGALVTGTATADVNVPIVCLCYAFDGSTTMMPVTFNSGGTFSQALDLSKLAAGPHTLEIQVQDAAGNTTTQTLHLNMAAAIPLQVSSMAPAAGTADVGVTFRPKVVFSRAVDTTTLNSNDFYATDTTGATIPATIVPSDDGTYAWLFFTNPLPGASAITLTVNGATIKAADGSLLDAADNGTPGSVLTSRFTTVSEAAVPGTTLSGIIADPGPDDKPMTRDDVRAGADGVLGTADDVYLRPVQGVKVYILGQESQAVNTDAQGRFSFSSVPSGDVKLAIEGNVTGVTVYDPTQQQFVDPNSEGFYFPSMTMDLTVKPGVANTVMGTMGTDQEQTTNATNLGVYLPRVQTSILQTLNTTQTTTVGVTGTSGLGLTPQQQQNLTLTVQPGTAVGMDGQKLSAAQVGISTVPPQIVMDMLPVGVMQHSFDITIQAPGVATFTSPAQLTFPNVFGAAPGTQLDVLSFDHTTGRLVIDGTATVSADGLSVTTDPGTGVTQPGWHALTPPGALANSESASISGVQVIDDDGDEDDGGTDDKDHDAREEANLAVNGKLGDVITVDLSSVELGDGSNNTVDDAFSGMQITTDDSPFAAAILDSNGNQIAGLNQFGVPMDVSAGANLGGETFYVVPNLGSFSANNLPPEIQLTLEGTVVNVGQDPNGPDQRHVTLHVYVDIGNGYSGTGSDAVELGNGGNQSIEPTTVDYYRFEQRLSYFGYNFDQKGNQVLVDGAQDHFEWANGIFYAGINSKSTASSAPFDSTEVPWLNASNAPRWKYVTGGTGWTVSAGNENYGTSWAEDVVNQAATTSPLDIRVTALSIKQGGPNLGTNGLPIHKGHQSGMNIDVGLTPVGYWYTFSTARALFSNSGAALWQAVNPKNAQSALDAVLSNVAGALNATLTANYSDNHGNNGWMVDQLISALYRMGGTYTTAISAQGDGDFNTGFDKVVGTVQGYDHADTAGEIEAFFNAAPTSRATVKHVIFNDPVVLALVKADGFNITAAKWHSNHFHVDVTAPDKPSSGGVQAANAAPADVSTATGFGSDPSLYYRFALPNGTAAVYGKSKANGSLSVFLGANLIYEATFYQPSTNHWADYLVQSNASGKPTNLGNIFLSQFGGTDTNGDGIPDMGKIAMGLNPALPDATADGLSYAQNLTLGLDPRGGTGSVTGVVANLALQGNAEAVTLQGSFTNAQGATAYVATGSYGLAIVDASNFEKPTLLSQLNLGGVTTDVAVDPNLQIAAMASNAGGLNFVDVSNPAQPQLLSTANVNAGLVRVQDGVAYAAVGTTVQAYDLLSGKVLQTLDLQGAAITAMALDGSFLYTLDAANSLHVIDLSGAQMVGRGSATIGSGATLAAGSDAMVVGGGIVYVGVTRYLNPPFGALSGYLTVNVANPDSPNALSGFPTTASAGQAIALNGSGIALTGGSDLSGPAVDVFNAADATTAGQFVGRFSLPNAPQGLVIGDGIAFVADGTSGLQIINYLQFDAKGVAPSASISLPASAIVGTANDGNPEVLEGSTLTLVANVSDDVQVQNVELLMNGKIVANAVSFPFDLSVALPTIAQNGSGSVTFQAIAFDTGGNVGRSSVLTVDLTPQSAIPLQLLNSNVTDGSTVGRSFHVLTFAFNKAIDGTTANASTFQLIGPNGAVVPTQIELRSQQHTLEISYPTLDLGTYTLTIDSANVKDIFGNALGSSPDVVHFTVLPFTITWINPNGGFWDVASNWDTGVVPGVNDDVNINVPGGNAVTFRSGNVTVAALTAITPFTLSGGTLSITSTGTIDGAFTFTGGTLSGSGTVTVAGKFNWSGGAMSGTGTTVSEANLTITVPGVYQTLNGWTLTNTGTATLSGGIRMQIGGNAVINNLSGATFDVQNAAGFQANSQISGNATFNNQGTLRKSGSGTTALGMIVNNTGTVEVDAGELSLTGGGSSTGAFTIGSGATLEPQTYTLQSGFSETGAGTFLVDTGTLNSAVNVTLQSLTVAGGTLTGAGTITVTGAVTWTGGTMSGTGQTVAQGTLAVVATGAYPTLDGRTLDNQGSATCTIANYQFYLQNGATLINETAATWDFQTNGNLSLGGGTATFTNHGLLKKSAGSGTTGVGVTLNNDGTVDVDSGELSFRGGGSSSGTFTVGSGATLEPQTLTLQSGFSETGAGTFLVDTGTLTSPVNITLQSLNVTGGTLTGAGTITVTGAITWSGGTMSGTGQTVAKGSLAVVATGAYPTLDGRTLDNQGSATCTIANYQFYLQNGATLINETAATWDFQTNGNLSLGGGTATFTNHGLLKKSAGTNTTTIGVPLNSDGTVEVDAGTLSLSNGGSASGSFSIAGGTVSIPGGTFTFLDGAQGTGSGTLAITGGTASIPSGASASVQNLALSSGALNGAGSLTVTGQLNWTGGTMSGTGQTVAQGALAVVATGAYPTLDGRTLDNQGSATCTIANYQFYLQNGATVINETAATWDFQTNGNLSLGGGTATFTNHGLLKKSAGTNTTTIGVPLNSDGTVEVDAGTLSLSNGGSASGSFSIAGGTVSIPSGTFTFLDGAQGTGTGTLSITGGTASLPTGASASVQNLALSSGALNGAGSLTVTGQLSWTGGTMSGTGQTVAKGSLAVVATGAYPTLDGRTLDNQGSATCTIANYQFYLQNGATVINEAAATWDFQTNGNLSLGGGTATFTNHGLLKKSAGTGTTGVGVTLSNDGTIEVDSGTLSLSNAPTNANTMTVAAGATLSLTGNFSEPASGILNIQIGGTSASQYGVLAITGSATLAGTLNVSLVNGFVPAVGNTFPVITYGSHTGTFDTINGLSLPNNESFTPSYNAANFTLTAGSPQRPSDANARGGGDAPPISAGELTPVVGAAIARWAETGIGSAKVAELRHVSVQLADLHGAFLGLEGDNTILIDPTADGYGWFVDHSPMNDSEFVSTLNPQEEIAPAGSPANGRMDLLTVMMHEMGHVLGLGDVPNGTSPDTLMTENLPTGVRRLPPNSTNIAPISILHVAPKDDTFGSLGAGVSRLVQGTDAADLAVPPAELISPTPRIKAPVRPVTNPRILDLIKDTHTVPRKKIGEGRSSSGRLKP
jgi:hypothetical protein